MWLLLGQAIGPQTACRSICVGYNAVVHSKGGLARSLLVCLCSEKGSACSVEFGLTLWGKVLPSPLGGG